MRFYVSTDPLAVFCGFSIVINIARNVNSVNGESDIFIFLVYYCCYNMDAAVRIQIFLDFPPAK